MRATKPMMKATLATNAWNHICHNHICNEHICHCKEHQIPANIPAQNVMNDMKAAAMKGTKP